MTVAAYLAILRRNLIWILLLMLIGGGAAYFYSQTLPKQYRSYTSVIVVPQRGESTSEIVQGSNYVQGIVQSYALLASTPYVLQPVIDELGLTETPGRLADRMTVVTPLNTVVIELTVTDGSPQQAQRIAAAVAESLIGAVEGLSPKIGTQPAVRLSLISPATLPQSHVYPDSRLITLAGIALGLVLALAIAFLREQLRSRPRNADDLEAVTDLPVIGEIPQLARGANLPKEVLQAPDGQAAEAVRALAASLRFVSVDRPAEVMIVTSALPSDGKSSIAMALALSLADSGRRTLVIDADLRNPTIADLIGIEGAVGLTTVLVHDCDFDEAIQPWGHQNLHVLPGGGLSPNPGQLISSGQLSETVALARERFDAVVIDTPPVLAVSDALWLSPVADGVIIITRARKTSTRSLREAIDAVASTHATILGLVLNGVRVAPDSRYHGAYYGKQAQPKRRKLLQRTRPR